ncbi:hypothetical protein BHE90_013780 [Fusarium euwallaceae]|uniref:Uncharacterized protein n=2 Tax=Fusarium solani species complex TaxID=232080 RepID=A0A430L7T6_9HYPO|nr:hypothetical protein CEP51_016527 [Fusarium floridanum]RTE71807.1 hypothetical protein BHE90_013780 [Fusarium euwallaceae]
MTLPPWLTTIKRRLTGDQESSEAAQSTASEVSDGRPPPPRELLAHRTHYELPLLNRRVDAADDSPILALYRIYEHLILDQHLEIRNEIEAFWYHKDWAVVDIPDPCDPDPERYTCLACIPALLCLAFNRRIEMGLPREAPPIFNHDMLDEWRAQEPKFEKVPVWTEKVPQIEETLVIPHWDNNERKFVPLAGFDCGEASKEFADKNILVWHPHVHFA